MVSGRLIKKHLIIWYDMLLLGQLSIIQHQTKTLLKFPSCPGKNFRSTLVQSWSPTKMGRLCCWLPQAKRSFCSGESCSSSISWKMDSIISKNQYINQFVDPVVEQVTSCPHSVGQVVFQHTSAQVFIWKRRVAWSCWHLEGILSAKNFVKRKNNCTACSRKLGERPTKHSENIQTTPSPRKQKKFVQMAMGRGSVLVSRCRPSSYLKEKAYLLTLLPCLQWTLRPPFKTWCCSWRIVERFGYPKTPRVFPKKSNGSWLFWVGLTAAFKLDVNWCWTR